MKPLLPRGPTLRTDAGATNMRRTALPSTREITPEGISVQGPGKKLEVRAKDLIATFAS